MVVGQHARLSPFVGVGAGHTGPVGIGKDGGHGGWLVLGGGEVVLRITGVQKTIKGEGENLACGPG